MYLQESCCSFKLGSQLFFAKGAESCAVGGTAPAASHSPAEASCAADLPFFSFKDGP